MRSFSSIERDSNPDFIDGPEPPRILIESSEYWLRNNGDLAMLAVTIRRLRELCPDARIGVLTDVAPLLHAYFPDAEAISFAGSGAWRGSGPSARLARRLGPRIVGPPTLAVLRSSVWVPGFVRALPRRTRILWAIGTGQLRWSQRHATAGGSSLANPGAAAAAVTEPTAPARAQTLSANVAAAVDSSSLLLALGGGYLTDVDSYQSHRLLNLLEYARERGVPAAMVGQGLGPIETPVLARRVADVLPGVDFISLREPLRGPSLLEHAGVPPQQIQVTGDDAIELARDARQPELGDAIGLCVRVADYSPVSANALEAIRLAVHEAAGEHNAPLAPLVIAEFRNQDRRSTLPLVRGYRPTLPPPPRYAGPHAVAAQVSRCRVVVTGAYHLAVFALSQGIPVVALTSSAYYNDKFAGLRAMFGDSANNAGMTVVALDIAAMETAGLRDHLVGVIRAAWDQAPTVRDPLIARADAQIAEGQRAFKRVVSLIKSVP